MKNLKDLIVKKEESTRNALNVIPLLNPRPKNSELIKIFTSDVEEVSLHYINSDEEISGYCHCLGNECPLCKAGDKATEYYLLPVFSVSLNSIASIRVSKSDEPHALLPQLLNHIEDSEMVKSIVEIIRKDNYRYETKLKKSDKYCEIGAAQIALFHKGTENGEINLKAAFKTHLNEDLRNIPHVALKLKILEDSNSDA